MKRSDFTKQNIQDFPSGGEYFQFKSFDSDAKKFTFGGKTIEKKYDKAPEKVVLENIELPRGRCIMEVQLIDKDGKAWGVGEVQIKLRK